jgi:NADH-quinone oxidoreductase subunit H
VVLSAKILLVILFFMLVRWSWPRFRFDQLMALAWKVMLPLGLVNLAVVAVLIEFEGVLDSRIVMAVSWVTTIAACLVTGWLAPLQTDNRPRLEGIK